MLEQEDITMYKEMIRNSIPECFLSEGKSISDELIDSYRVNNFIVFSKERLSFLEQETMEAQKTSSDLRIDIVNLKKDMDYWKIIEE